MEKSKVIRRFIPMSETMFYILFSLRRPRHGYGIMQDVEELTNKRIRLGAGTIYQSLSKLEEDKLIKAVNETARKKEYLVTELGSEILLLEAKRIKELYQIVKEVLE